MDLKDPQTQRALLGVILIAGLGYAFYQYLYTPKKAQLAEMESEAQRLEGYNESARSSARSDRISELEKERVALLERVKIYEELIPNTEQVPLLLERVATSALESDVDLLSFTPLPAEPGAFYTEQLYDVEVRGGYHEIGVFLARVASLPRIIKPAVTELMAEQVQEPSRRADPTAPPPPPQTLVHAKVRLSAYVVPGGEAPVAAADTSAARTAPIGLGAAGAPPGAEAAAPPPASAPAPAAPVVPPLAARLAPGVAPAVEAEQARAAAIQQQTAAAEGATVPPPNTAATQATAAPTTGTTAAPATAPSTPGATTAPAPQNAAPAAPAPAAPAPAAPARPPLGQLPALGGGAGAPAGGRSMPGDVPPLEGRNP